MTKYDKYCLQKGLTRNKLKIIKVVYYSNPGVKKNDPYNPKTSPFLFN